MRLTLAAVGRPTRGPEDALADGYARRIDALSTLTRLGPIEQRYVEDRGGRGAEAEAALMLEALASERPPADRIVALDERGEAPSSAAFARRLGAWRDEGVRRTAFVIGGADGHGAAMRARADWLLALGPMTWPHALARALIAEQIYRAATLLAGHPYHRA